MNSHSSQFCNCHHHHLSLNSEHPFGNPPGLHSREVLTVFLLFHESPKLQRRKMRTTESRKPRQPLRTRHSNPCSPRSTGTAAGRKGGSRIPRGLKAPRSRRIGRRQPRTRPVLPFLPWGDRLHPHEIHREGESGSERTLAELISLLTTILQ